MSVKNNVVTYKFWRERRLVEQGPLGSRRGCTQTEEEDLAGQKARLPLLELEGGKKAGQGTLNP